MRVEANPLKPLIQRSFAQFESVIRNQNGKTKGVDFVVPMDAISPFNDRQWSTERLMTFVNRASKDPCDLFPIVEKPLVKSAGTRLAALPRRWAAADEATIVDVARQAWAESTAPMAQLSLFFTRLSNVTAVPKKKILILMSDTGGGHRASAQALNQALDQQFPGSFDIQILDIWSRHGSWPYNKVVPVYQFLGKHPLLWRTAFAYGSFPVTKAFQEVITSLSNRKVFKQVIEKAAPDMVISVHPLCHHIPIPIVQSLNVQRLKDKRPLIPFVTVVTDLASAHVTWFDKRVDAYFVPSDEVRRLAIRAGISSDKIIMRGLPVRPAFWSESTKPKLLSRRDLGLPLADKIVLLMGGGDGFGGLSQIASAAMKALSKIPKSSQLIVVCGHNKRALRSLKQKLAPPSDSSVHVKVHGFLNNIDNYMAASDCLITKAGPGTIAEAMIRGLPVILSSYLPGQVSLS
jgi:1,2-diacylglycerol 3-beta-galactosyltransferase